ncbi:PAXNEB-domain-containing protein [Mycena floridula]|nr:PAXNEB-domain-containing protein [Mycena floridula]
MSHDFGDSRFFPSRMSSFKRKATAPQSVQLAGTKPSLTSSTTSITSTGIPSLDDILGGGLPLSCVSLTLAPDPHSSFGQLVQKYFIAQGLSCSQEVCVIHEDAEEFVKGCMWLGASETTSSSHDLSQDDGQKVKIAWRYEQMKQFQTTVIPTGEEFCRPLDLVARIPESILESAINSHQLSFLNLKSDSVGEKSISRILRKIEGFLKQGASPARAAVRLCFPSIGSPHWGYLTPQDILSFLHSLRFLLRRHQHACASLNFAAHLVSEKWGGPGWVQKLAWLSDSAISLTAFSANPSLLSLFPSSHGFVSIHSLPCPHTLTPASNKYSTLRGLSSSSGSGSGENNLAFKCTRKRLVIETLHLDLEGGVGERRTTASSNVLPGDGATEARPVQNTASAAVEVEFEAAVVKEKPNESEKMPAKLKPKRKVAFQSDTPDLYDF